MERRTAESPMDFEWQTRAPGDVTSPFYQLGLQHDNQKKCQLGIPLIATTTEKHQNLQVISYSFYIRFSD